MAAVGKFPPYLRVTSQRRDERGLHLEFRLLRWHPAWWARIWYTATQEFGLPWWNPFTWLTVLQFIMTPISDEQ